MLRRMTMRQFLEWYAHDQVEPLPDHRSDWQAASICSEIWNVAFARAGNEKRMSPRDFILKYGVKVKADEKGEKAKPVAAPPRKTWQEMRFIAQMVAAAANSDEEQRQRKRKRK